MKKKEFKYIYGPVPSWRLGASLGIDLFAQGKKVCNFDCIYCQVGRTKQYTPLPRLKVKISEVIEELKQLPKLKVDYITFSGRGDPSLIKNLGRIINAVKKLKIAKVAVLTNGALINRPQVRKNLSAADVVVVKLDAYSQASLKKINRPAKGIKFEKILEGIKQFRKSFKGKLALQIMFVPENEKHAGSLAQLAWWINPDQVQVNTPRRVSRVKPLTKQDIARIKECFFGMDFISVYNTKSKKVFPISTKETLIRRGKVAREG